MQHESWQAESSRRLSFAVLHRKIRLIGGSTAAGNESGASGIVEQLVLEDLAVVEEFGYIERPG